LPDPSDHAVALIKGNQENLKTRTPAPFTQIHEIAAAGWAWVSMVSFGFVYKT
jgi:hypothetical protein